MTQDLAKQTQNAFEFIEKLNFEVSYLIKEIEGLLALEPEQFKILKPSGYAVTAKKSNGLDPVLVEQWLKKNMAVFFGAKNNIRNSVTSLHEDLKILFTYIQLFQKDIDQPKVYFGMLSDIHSKQNENKFEKLAFEFAYRADKFINLESGSVYEDNYCSFKMDVIVEDLFSINNSTDVLEKIAQPMLNIYRTE